MTTDSRRYQGTSVPRTEGLGKATGTSRYVDDIRCDGMLFGATIRSQVVRGRITGIRFGEGVPWDEFVVVHAADIPGRNVVALVLDDQPCLAADRVNHAAEPVCLIAHADKALVARAAALVHVDVEEEPGVFEIDEALTGRSIVWGTDNVFKDVLIEKGDVAEGFARASQIVEATYETGAQEHLYIEPNGMIAVPDADGGITVWGSLQCPFYVQRALEVLLGLPAERVRVVQTETGGGFGGKEEYPSMIAGHAALLARKAGRPVKLVYDRHEDMVATTKRHPSRTIHRTAIDSDGTLLAMEVDFVVDGGAYATLSPIVVSRGAIHAAGPYRCPNVSVRGRAVATNVPPHGAFRGFGAPQSLFALERHMNAVAQVAGLSPEAFRRRNLLRPGETTATGQVVKDTVDLTVLMDRALSVSRYRERQAAHDRFNETSADIKRGVGFSTFFHGAGFTGSGEKRLLSTVAVEAMPDGRVRILASSTEIGQGTNTVFAQIAADALQLMPAHIEVARPDTSVVPDSGPTVASRTTMIVGRLVERACLGLLERLQANGLPSSHTPEQFRDCCHGLHARGESLRTSAAHAVAPDISWDDEHHRGDAYATFAWACYVADVEVDMRLFEVTVRDVVAVQDAGAIVHPVMAAGQIEGGVAQGLGFALSEQVVWRDGRMANASMADYIVPTALDVPPIRVVFEDSGSTHGPGGAKGLGELPLDGTAPAIVNAIEAATNLPIVSIPATPERLLALAERAGTAA